MDFLYLAVDLKKASSILLLGTILFNLFGYQLLYYFLENKANAKLEESLNSNLYSQQDLISFKVPIKHLAYYSNSHQYQRMDGEIEISGVRYHYVQCRLFNDTLELQCVPNYEEMQLGNQKAEFCRLASGLDQAGQSRKSVPHTASFKYVSVEYLKYEDFLITNPSRQIKKRKPQWQNAAARSFYLSPIDQPPRA
jgi:hypothetical protein